jgi:hypothetical protein
MSTDTILVPESKGISRRTALRLAFVSAPVVAGMAIPAIANAAPRPTGTAYVKYESIYKSGDTFQAVVNKVTGNRILSLPAGTFTWSDFKNGYYNGIRIGTGAASGCRGIAGSGRTTILYTKSNTASRNMGGNTAGSQLEIANHSSCVLTNFTLKGMPQNGLYYHGIKVSQAPNAVLSNLYLRGASRGDANSPPGESFGINVWRSDNTIIKDCEIDGRNDAGTRVCASPMGFNTATNAKVYRVYAHHGLASMLTFFETKNIYTEDYHCFSTSSGSGKLAGSGINHEQSSGAIKHVRPNLIMNGKYATTSDHTASVGNHMSYANTLTDLTNIQVLEPIWDKNVGSTGMFMVAIRDAYTIAGAKQKIKTPPKIVKNGVTLKASHSNTSGWSAKAKASYFGWIH